MGGVGSGGRRVGAGRKPKSEYERELGGNAAKRGRVLAHPSVPAGAPVVDEFDAPNCLTLDERHVWLELAPHAFKKGTLTPGTSYAFVVLVRHVLLERQFAASVTEKGSSKHNAALKEVNKGLDAYGLRANGKPIYDGAAAVPVNRADAFRKAKTQA